MIIPKVLTQTNGYKTLVNKVSRELSELEFFVKHRTAEAYWRVGKFIHENLLAHKDRADYGAPLFERLAKDVDRDLTTLSRAVQFYRAYPILAAPQELTWEHYKGLITVKDKQERKKLEDKIIRNDWTTGKLREYLSGKRARPSHPPGVGRSQTVPQLSFTRGRLHTYQIVKANEPLAKINPLVLDLGFRLQCVYPKNSLRFKENDLVELIYREPTFNHEVQHGLRRKLHKGS